MPPWCLCVSLTFCVYVCTVLIEVSKLPLAVATLRTLFTVLLEDESSTYGHTEDTEVAPELMSAPVKPHPHPIFVLPCKLRLAKIRKADVKFHAYWILKLFMFPTDTGFVSFTETEDEVSLVFPATDAMEEVLGVPGVV